MGTLCSDMAICTKWDSVVLDIYMIVFSICTQFALYIILIGREVTHLSPPAAPTMQAPRVDITEAMHVKAMYPNRFHSLPTSVFP